MNYKIKSLTDLPDKFKIDVRGEATITRSVSEVAQKRLFELGARWKAGNQNIITEPLEVIYCESEVLTNGFHTIARGSTREEYFWVSVEELFETEDADVKPASTFEMPRDNTRTVSSKIAPKQIPKAAKASTVEGIENLNEHYTDLFEGMKSALLALEGVEEVNVIANTKKYPNTEGRPPYSFECTVLGGKDIDIADTIWVTKPVGYTTYGSKTAKIKSKFSNGIYQVHWSRPKGIKTTEGTPENILKGGSRFSGLPRVDFGGVNKVISEYHKANRDNEVLEARSLMDAYTALHNNENFFSSRTRHHHLEGECALDFGDTSEILNKLTKTKQEKQEMTFNFDKKAVEDRTFVFGVDVTDKPLTEVQYLQAIEALKDKIKENQESIKQYGDLNLGKVSIFEETDVKLKAQFEAVTELYTASTKKDESKEA